MPPLPGRPAGAPASTGDAVHRAAAPAASPGSATARVSPAGGETRFFGAPVSRNEDPRLLTGRALFVDDVELPGMLHAALLRSPHAHARIAGIDAAAARARPGVVAVFTAADLGDYWQPGPLLVPPPPTIPGLEFHQRTQVPLARDVVRHVGEPVALVIAESRYLAEDAAGEIEVEYEPLPVVADLEAALQPGAPLVHADLGHNVAARVHQRKGDYAAAKGRAAHVIRRRYSYEHGLSAPMETRGVVAQWDGKADKLTVWDTTQAPVAIRNGLAAMLGLSERQVRVIAPFIGGGFGPKIMMFYPEEVLIPWAALQLDQPVKWIEDRLEHFFATTHERGQIHEAELALDAEGRILGIQDRFLHDTGAYDPYGLTVPINSQCTLLNVYDVPHYDSAFTAVFTNRTLVTPYRGAGRQHGIFVIERLLDAAARELGIDRAEIRRRNLIRPDAFPYDNRIIYQDFAPLVYDSGDYEPILDKALDAIGYAQFLREEQPRARAEGRHLGIGIVCYVEGTGIGPYEGARVHVQNSGKVSVATGIGTQGQGHYTAFAQIVADQCGVDLRDVEVVTGDTDQFAWGAGTFASRGAVVAGNAVQQAALVVRQKILRAAAEHFECAEADLVIADGQVSILGVPGHAIRLGALAQLANPMRGAVQPGTEPGLEATQYFGPASGATASGVHAMIVEVDPLTMAVSIRRYVVVHDCGTVINPLILAGQIHGGVAQGIGNAFFEKIAYDAEGQILNASFADYLLPTALDVPRMQLEHTVTPSPLNPMGVKGAGEAGAIPVGPLFAQAVEDALDLPARGVEIREIPLSPCRLWELASGAS
ncbi:molybdopterin cofactor-binding domain-containing protein [Roseomonas sp. BN140053]|uniref:molybdopterin cofactor-binding domain-containing protein n=1 Tax=Roseomonas sp. BN140053 TaxID=3391898 RepID=UPI0039ED041D